MIIIFASRPIRLLESVSDMKEKVTHIRKMITMYKIVYRKSMYDKSILIDQLCTEEESLILGVSLWKLWLIGN